VAAFRLLSNHDNFPSTPFQSVFIWIVRNSGILTKAKIGWKSTVVVDSDGLLE